MFGLGCPEDLEMLACSGNRRVKDIVRDVVLIGVRDHDLHRVILKALCLVDGYSVGNLERYGSGRRVVIVVPAATLLDVELHR